MKKLLIAYSIIAFIAIACLSVFNGMAAYHLALLAKATTGAAVFASITAGGFAALVGTFIAVVAGIVGTMFLGFFGVLANSAVTNTDAASSETEPTGASTTLAPAALAAIPAFDATAIPSDLTAQSFTGDILVAYEFVTREQVNEGLEIQQQERAAEATSGNKARFIGEILVGLGYISTGHVDFAMTVQKHLRGN